MTTLDDVVTELRRIGDLLEGQRRSSLSRSDRERLIVLLPAAAGVLGSELFTSRELVNHPAPALRLVLEGQSAKAIGKLLTRGQGQCVGGFVVVDEGDEGHVKLWRIAGC